MNSNISTQLALEAARARGARAPVTSDPSDQMNKCEERLLTLVEGLFPSAVSGPNVSICLTNRQDVTSLITWSSDAPWPKGLAT